MSPPQPELLYRYRLGRSTNRVDISIEDQTNTVSGIHAEMGVDSLGRWHFIDRSTNGSEVFRDGDWQPLVLGPIGLGERLRLGSREISVDWLIDQAERLQNLGHQPRTMPPSRPPSPRLEVVPRGQITERVQEPPLQGRAAPYAPTAPTGSHPSDRPYGDSGRSPADGRRDEGERRYFRDPDTGAIRPEGRR